MGILPWHSYLCKFSREKIWLYVTCIKITKYPSNTIMFGFLIFKKYIFFLFFVYAIHGHISTWNFARVIIKVIYKCMNYFNFLELWNSIVQFKIDT
jgi:hypothetical protein